jgi:hypothetical protein
VDRPGIGPPRLPRQEGVTFFPPLHRTIILVAGGGIIERRVAQRHADRSMPPELFDHRSRGPGLEERGGEGMAQCVRRLRLRDPCDWEILGHQRLESADAERRAGPAGAGKAVCGLERLGVAPLMQRVVGIKGAIDHPIDLAFTVVDAHGSRLEIDAGPREGADLTNSQPAPHQQPKHRALAPPINPSESLDEISFVPRFGKTLGDDHMRPAPMNRWLSDQPPLV